MYAKAEFFNPCSSVKDRYVPERDRTRPRVSVSWAFTPDRTRSARAVGPIGTEHPMILVLPLFALFRFRGLASSEKTHRTG
jgi:hypothetical protein